MGHWLKCAIAQKWAAERRRKCVTGWYNALERGLASVVSIAGKLLRKVSPRFHGRCPLDPSFPLRPQRIAIRSPVRPAYAQRGRHKMLSPGSTAKARSGSPVRLASATTNFPSTTLTPVLRSFMREGMLACR